MVDRARYHPRRPPYDLGQGLARRTSTSGSRPLRTNRDFQFLWVGQALSTTGSLASFIALPIFVLTLTGSSAEAGLVGFFNVGTAMAASLPGGALADRCNRRTIMLVSDLARAGGMALLAAAAMAHRASLPLVLAVAAADGGLSSLFAPAEVAALRRIVDDKQLPSALARNQARTAAAALVGPPLGGFLFGLSHSLPFAVNALSYGASFFCVLLVRTPLHLNRTPGEGTVARDLFAGLRFLDEADATNRAARELRAKGVKAMIAVFHEGFELGTAQKRGDWNDLACPEAHVAKEQVRHPPSVAPILVCQTGVTTMVAARVM